MRRTPAFLILTILFLLLAVPTAAVAGTPPPGSISFEPGFAGSVSIPTMGGIGLVLLALVLGVVAVQHIRSNGGQLGSFLVAGLATGALLSAGGGATLISQSHALVASDFTITNPEGETLDVNFREPNSYTNASGVPMGVSALSLPLDCAPPDTESTCEVGDELEDGASCEVDCSFEVEVEPN